MNGRVAKLLRIVFNPSDGAEKRREYRKFKKAYKESNVITELEILKQAKKISSVRKKGGMVKTFRFNPDNHQMDYESLESEPEGGNNARRPKHNKNNARATGSRKKDNQKASRRPAQAS